MATTAPADLPRRFYLARGAPGGGVAAYGVRWPDGSVTVQYPGGVPQSAGVEFWDAHGPGGRERLVWVDAPPPVPVRAGYVAFSRQAG